MNPIKSLSLRGAIIGLTLLSATPHSQPIAASAATVLPPQAAAEVRGMWVVRTSITTPESIARVVSLAKSHNFNTLFVQVRGRGDAFYQSDIEPRSEELDGQPASFDPLAETLRQAHAAGLQVHAWMNTCFIWGSPHKPVSPMHVVNAHPEWLDRDTSGHSRMTTGSDCEGAFLSPGNLAARKHIHDVFLEVATKYDIDGIHFDYIRYPNLTFDYSNASVSRFQDEIVPTLGARQCAVIDARLHTDRLAYVHAFPGHYADFRRRQVTEMVRDISHDLKAVRPSIIVSAAVFADSKDAYKVRGQDWKTWLREGYLDAVVPMAYGVDTVKVTAQIADAVSCANESHRFVYAGIGSWHIPPASTIAKISAARRLGVQGEVLFSYGGITKDGATAVYLDKVSGACFKQPASVPQMAWMPSATNKQANTDAEAGQDAGG